MTEYTKKPIFETRLPVLFLTKTSACLFVYGVSDRVPRTKKRAREIDTALLTAPT